MCLGRDEACSPEMELFKKNYGAWTIPTNIHLLEFRRLSYQNATNDILASTLKVCGRAIDSDETSNGTLTGKVRGQCPLHKALSLIRDWTGASILLY